MKKTHKNSKVQHCCDFDVHNLHDLERNLVERKVNYIHGLFKKGK